MIALMMEAARTSKTLVNFYHTTRRYNPEDSRLSTLLDGIMSLRVTNYAERVTFASV
jgi:hypothetical protein